jgi:hypothetical protein
MLSRIRLICMPSVMKRSGASAHRTAGTAAEKRRRCTLSARPTGQCAGERWGGADSDVDGIAWPSGVTPGAPSPVVAGSVWHRDLLGRCSQRRHRSPERRIRGQHTNIAVPVRARRWHQRRNAGDQFQRREVQFVDLGATLVRARLAALLGTAVDQGGPLCEGGPWQRAWGGGGAPRSSATAAPGRRGRLLRSRQRPSTEKPLCWWASISLASQLSSRPRPTKACRMRRRKSACAWATAVASMALAG